jgi:hypothetical protein
MALMAGKAVTVPAWGVLGNGLLLHHGTVTLLAKNGYRPGQQGWILAGMSYVAVKALAFTIGWMLHLSLAHGVAIEAEGIAFFLQGGSPSHTAVTLLAAPLLHRFVGNALEQGSVV